MPPRAAGNAIGNFHETKPADWEKSPKNLFQNYLKKIEMMQLS